MATACTPRSRITASSACRSGASGVVRTLGSASSATRVSMVPTSPVTRPAARRPGLEQVGRGGLAVGPGHADQGQVAGRVAVDPGRQRAEHRTGRLHDVRREAGRQGPGRPRPGRSGRRRRRAARRRGREVRAVRAGAGRCRVEVTGPDRAGVERDPGHDRLGRGPGRRRPGRRCRGGARRRRGCAAGARTGAVRWVRAALSTGRQASGQCVVSFRPGRLGPGRRDPQRLERERRDLLEHRAAPGSRRRWRPWAPAG